MNISLRWSKDKITSYRLLNEKSATGTQQIQDLLKTDTSPEPMTAIGRAKLEELINAKMQLVSFYTTCQSQRLLAFTTNVAAAAMR